MGVGLGEEEVLELGEGEEGRGLDDIDAERGQDGVVEEKRVLEGQLAARVGLLGAAVFDGVDLGGGPACCDVTADGLEEDRPGAGEAGQSGGGAWGS